MTQLDLLDYQPRAHARREDPRTSRAAADSMKEGAGALCTRLLEAFRTYGAMTRSEVARRVGLSDYQVSKRLSDLQHANLLQDTGTTRPGPTGRQQTVWTAA
jgi:predicted ArsR family transcriptional regulator